MAYMNAQRFSRLQEIQQELKGGENNGSALNAFDKAMRISQQKFQAPFPLDPAFQSTQFPYDFQRSVSNGLSGDPFLNKIHPINGFSTQSSMRFKPTGIKLQRIVPASHHITKLNSFQVGQAPSLFADLEEQPAQSLGDTLKQKRELREHIEKERAQSRLGGGSESQQPLLRIRPATPKLNLLKMRKQPLAQKLDPIQMPNQTQKRLLPKAGNLQPLEKQPELPNVVMPEAKKRKKKRNKQVVDEVQKLIEEVCEDKLQPKYDNEDLEIFERDEQENVDEDGDEEYEEEETIEVANGGLLVNFQEKFEEILENEEVEDAIELNEKFLAEHLGVPQDELSRLQKIELRVDTSCHNLQVTGEILSSLEYLKMNDSIIKCFRDLGTSFRFVRILHLARCELKEVQGIQAFINLEELYISYNNIDDLFDISFLEHLSVLDMEGNNVSNGEHLYYLKRLTQLTHLNLSHNPVTSSDIYYPRIKENTPNLLVLDDELVLGSRFYDSKLYQQNIPLPKFDLSQSKLMQRLLQIGISETLIHRFAQESLSQIETDQSDLDLLVDAIKSQSLEVKAARQFRDFEFDQSGDRVKTPSKTFKIMKDGTKRAVTPSKQMMFSANSFYKSSTRKSTSMTNENDGSVGNRSGDSNGGDTEIKKKPSLGASHSKKLAILRRRHSQLDEKVAEGQKPLHQDNMISNQGDIQQIEIRTGQDQTDKLGPNSAIAFYSNGLRAASKSSTRPQGTSSSVPTVVNSGQSVISLQSATSLQQLDADSIIQSAQSKENKLRASFGGGVPSKNVEKIVLKPSDIQFSASFKRRQQ